MLDEKAGFPTGVKKMGMLFKVWRGGRLKSIRGGGGHGGLKMLSIIFEGVHLTVKLPAIILQACKFTNNELPHIHFSRILPTFKVIIYCAISTNHFMEGFFTFQWGGSCFSDRGASFFKWGVRPMGGSVLMGGVFKKKSYNGGGGVLPMPPLHNGKPWKVV